MTMITRPAATSLPAVLPLTVPAFGREWHLTPWLEPVWWADGRLAALEMLTRPAERETGIPASPEMFFAQIPLSEQFRVLRWQLDTLVLMSPWCSAREVPVSINITRPLAMLILSEPPVQEVLMMLAPRVRLEISERFLPAGTLPQKDPFLQGLVALAPLWLDDFGAGTTALSWLMSGLFESVKIDRHLLQDLQVHPEGQGFLAALCDLARGAQTQVIAEGVADAELLAFVRRAQATACQGWLWPGLTPDRLHTLAECLPVEVAP